MALPYKFNFRSTSTFVTDAAGETYCISGTNTASGNSELYPVTRDGITFGWDTGTATRDLGTGAPIQMAGAMFNDVVLAATFQVDLPSTGTYSIRVAAGYRSGSFANTVKLYDNATLFATLTGTPGADSYIDASNSIHTAANWAANNTAVSRTFASTTFKVVVGDGVSNTTGFIAHLEIASAASATVPKVIGGGCGGGIGAVIS